MVNKLKGIFNNHDNTKKGESDNKKYSSFEEFLSVNWKQEGWNSARNQNGGQTALKVCISRIYHNHKKALTEDRREQEIAKAPYRVKLQEYIQQNEFYSSKIDTLNTKSIPEARDKVSELKGDIRDIKKNPEEHIGTKSEKAGFVIGLVILTFLTLYLFVFYSSASYSAFFKEFTLNELGVADSIFDPQAITKALDDGTTELILILTIPFVFLGLGYLIHKFQEQKNNKKYVQISLLIAVTFVFDAILAYEITAKIYDLNAANSFETMPKYDLQLAFQSVNFWLIIFAGFVVYLIWGFVFDFVMDTHYKMDKITVAINNKKEEIASKNEAINQMKDEISKLEFLKSKNNTEIKQLNTIINHSNIIKPKQLENSIHQFLDGWLEWLTSDRRSEKDKQSAHNMVDEFIAINVQSKEIEKSTNEDLDHENQ